MGNTYSDTRVLEACDHSCSIAVAHVRFPGWLGQPWFQWLRLPLQFVLIAVVLHYSRPPAQFRTEVISLSWQPARKIGFPWKRF